MKCIKRISIILGMLISAANCYADTYELKKEVYRSFKVSDNSSVEVENKYGDIYIEVWDQDSVGFAIEIEAYSEKYEHLQTLIDMVEINFNDYSSFVIAKTEWAKSQNFMDRAKFGIAKNIAGTREVRINYRIYAPKTVTLSIENEYGDIFIDEFDGDLSIENSHGEIRANRLTNIKMIKAKYGEVKIEEGNGGRLDLSYIKGADLGTLTDVFVKSTYSEIDIESMDVLRLESRLDELYIEDLGSVSGKTNLTKLHIKNLREAADLESKYGNVRVDDLASTAGEVKFNGSNTDYSINFSGDVTGAFQVQMIGNRDFSPEDSSVKVHTKNDLDDKTIFSR